MGNRLLLDNYIQSLGVELPKDWTRYQLGHEYESLCVLCHEDHSYIELYVYNPDNPSYRKGTATYVCDDCQLAIENSLLRITYPEFAEKEHEDFDYQGYVGVAPVETRNNRIVTFNTSYEFDDSVKFRYAHLSAIKDRYIHAVDTKRCYFCETIITISNPIKIHVPRMFGEHMTGGVVKCCTECYPKLDKELLNLDLQSMYDVQATRCSSCQQRYLMDRFEASHVNNSKSNFRMCPECTYETLDNLPNNTYITYVAANADPRRGPMVRFKECRCDYCMNNFRIDLTESAETNNKHNLGFLTVCTECRKLSPKYIVPGAYVYKHTTTVWAVVTHGANGWGYIILKLHSTGGITELLKTTSENTHDSLVEAVSMVSQTCYDMVEGRQYKLWDPQET